jgi:transcriptional regulator of aroF, aroG, tyrA and aromatic amino acid transport
MRIDVQFIDRVGIAHEILAVLAARRLNVVAVEVDESHVYIDAPELSTPALPDVSAALSAVAGVVEVTPVDLLPGARRSLHLAALLAAMPDPVLAIDAQATVVVANATAAAIAGVSESALCGLTLGDLFGDPDLQRELVEARFRAPVREVMLHGTPLLIEVTPIAESPAIAGFAVVGGVVTLHAPSRIGERLHAWQHFAEGGFESILGQSPVIQALKARAARVAALDAPLLILGETGTGKELVAHACHRTSPRRGAPFLALNCAALPESLAESELFGYAPGAFSGAQRSGKPGLLELANHGTVFLDEVGELSPYLQAKLLRFLNDGSFLRVGGERELKVDVRIISATHRNLEAMVAERSFREDLFYRLNVLNIQVPPLRARGDDILLLARHFIGRAATQAQRPPCKLTTAANEALRANSWPGNVRQLENVIFRAVTMSDQPVLDLPDLELAGSRVARHDPGFAAEADWEEALATFEKDLLGRLYPLYPSSRRLAAHLKTSHTMIANKLRKYGIAGRY